MALSAGAGSAHRTADDLATLTDQLYTHRVWLRRALDAQRLAFLLLTAALIGALFP
ncbi:hypothetical protein ACIBHY_52660 [Nonomuraea sp. NPDC050547]|uniref:hypothetical protein n=1 Tax=Nonomuraea sp. NPDC050547 TaxID=3364368 RepID=UPI00378B45D6